MKRKIAIAVVIIIAAAELLSCFYQVSVVDNVVVTQFGKPVHSTTRAGLHVKAPFPLHKVRRFDNRDRVFTSRLMEFLTEDGKIIVVRFYVCWNIESPLVYLKSVATSAAADQKLDDTLTSKAGSAIGDFHFDHLITTEEPSRMPELEKSILENVTPKALKDYGIKIQEVGISRFAFPEANAYSVYDRMRSERKAIAKKYRAEGEKEAAVIRAKAERNKSEVLSEAYKKAQIIRGEGEAEAARIYAEAFRKDAEFYRFWRTLKSYEKVLDKKTTLVLDEDSKLFEYLK